MNKIRLSTLLCIFVLVLPNTASAADQIGYEFLQSMMDVSQNFTLTLYEALAQSFQSLFYKIAVIIMVIHAAKMMFGSPDIFGLIRLVLTIVFVNAIAFSADIFQDWIYEPIMQTVYSLPAFVVKIATNISSVTQTNEEALKAMFAAMSESMEKIRAVGSLIADSKGLLKGTIIFFQGLALNIIYLVLYVIFVTMFILGIIAAHIMLVVAPFAIALIAFPQLRGLSFNVIRSFFTYSLIPFFAAVAMGMTLMSMSSLVNQADILLQSGNIEDISDTFFLQAILIGLFSIFFHLKASEFATQTVGGQISHFGQTFASMMGLAAATSKIAAARGISVARSSARVAGDAGKAIRERQWSGVYKSSSQKA